jgi:hypothetical protein
MTQEETSRTERPDPEVKPTAPRRRFSAKEKLRILEEADGCKRWAVAGGVGSFAGTPRLNSGSVRWPSGWATRI